MTMPSWIRNAFTRRPVTRPIRQARHRARPALEVLESRDLLSGIATTLSDMRSDFLPPVDHPVVAGLPATSGPLGTGGSTAANVNTDTEAIAGPHNETSIAVDPDQFQTSPRERQRLSARREPRWIRHRDSVLARSRVVRPWTDLDQLRHPFPFEVRCHR